MTRGASNALGGRGGTPRRGRSEGRDALFVCVFACGVASRSRGRRGCARGVSRTSPRGPRSHREADPFGHGNSVPLAPSPRAEVTRTRGPRPRRPPKPHARHPPAADGTDGQPPQPPSSRVVSSAPASDSAPPVKKTKKFRAVKIASPTPSFRRHAPPLHHSRRKATTVFSSETFVQVHNTTPHTPYTRFRNTLILAITSCSVLPRSRASLAISLAPPNPA